MPASPVRYRLTRERQCWVCGGLGKHPARCGTNVEVTCPQCAGSGWWRREEVDLVEALVALGVLLGGQKDER